MNCARIQTGETERIEALILDGSLSPLTGKTDILLSIRRVSDGFWYDFNDDTFKSSGWTTRQQQMTETDSANDQGVYHYNFDTSAITNATADDTYQMRVEQSPGTDAANVPLTGELKVGQFVDNIDQALSTTESNIRGADSDDLKDLSDQLDAVQTDLDNPSQYQADVSGLATSAALAAVETNIRGADGDDLKDISDQLDGVAPANEYDAVLANLDVAVSSRAPSGEYDTQLDANISTRAPANEYDVPMANLDAAVSTRAPAGEYDTQLDAAISSRAPANEYDVILTALAVDIEFIKQIEGGRWELTGSQMIFYEDDNTTEVARFDITLDGNDNPIERTRV
jgi:hypothetical protein